jgi:hypothetical protein
LTQVCGSAIIEKSYAKEGDMIKRFFRKITADTLALIIFSVATGALGIMFERWVAGLSWVQMGGIRLAYNLLKYALGGICGRIADWLRKLLMGSSKHPFRSALADGLALSVYQIPLYVACALLAQASPKKVAVMVAFYSVNNLVLGWLYGAILNRVRTWFSVRNGNGQAK